MIASSVLSKAQKLAILSRVRHVWYLLGRGGLLLNTSAGVMNVEAGPIIILSFLPQVKPVNRTSIRSGTCMNRIVLLYWIPPLARVS